MNNTYEVRGETTAIIIDSPKYGRMEALISSSKLQRANELDGGWRAVYSENTQSFYVYGNTPTVNGKRSTVRLHRWITNAPKSMFVDHKNNNTLDNTDLNLRVCSPSQNSQNRKGATAINKCGIRDVYWNKRRGKWRAQLKVGNKNKHVGYFIDILDAEKAVKKARAEMMPYSQEAM